MSTDPSQDPAADAHDDEHDEDAHDDRAAEGVEHLQTAAHEMIAAARAFLDVVEEVVGDRKAVSSLVDTIGSVAQAAARAATGRVPGSHAGGPGAGQGPAGNGSPGRPDSKVEHIRLS